MIRNGRKKYCFKDFPQDIIDIIEGNECLWTIKDKLADSWSSLQ
jgi:hypothetical protein